MGLCKCPKKKVTNQFCFEHRVNVCEHCMVTNHTKCVVQSYIQWLQDSDYNPNCLICSTELSDGDCIRLSCYHVFHWDCINKRALSLPSHTPPENYTCPICNLCIFPPPNAASPVAEALRNVLLSVNWARKGMGYPDLESDLLQQNSHSTNVQFSTPRETTALPMDNSTKPTPIPINSTNQSELNNIRPEPYGASYTSSYSNPRKVYDTREYGHYRPVGADHDEDKYKRRSALEWFARWFRSRTTSSRSLSTRRDTSVLYRRWMILLVLCLIGLCTLCIFFLKWGRANAETDPLLDPRFNPNIRVESEQLPNAVLKEDTKELMPA